MLELPTPPMTSRYVPTGHGISMVVFGQKLPTEHGNCQGSAIAVPVQCVPGGQVRQALMLVDSMSGLYVKMGHGNSTLAPGQKWPTLHENAAGVPSSHVKPGGHTPHAASDVAPTDCENVPLVHGEGTWDPVGQKNPRGQISPLGDCPVGWGTEMPW